MNTPRGHQPATGDGLPALHSYAHVAQHPNVHPYFKLARPRRAARAAGDGGPWNVPDLCQAYNWPTGLTGGGVIAIVELGGGWVHSDMDQFFRGINQPVPNITDVSVDGTQNTPDPSPNSADGEVALDIEVAAAGYYAATGKPATIRVYWAQDIASAVRAATADNCDVCSISWGADEANWGAHRAGNILRPINANRRGFAGRHIIRGSGNLDVERHLAIGTVRTGIRGVLGPVDRDIGNVRNRLADPAEELSHIGLHPAPAEFDDGDDTAADEAGRPIVGVTQVRHVPRAATPCGVGGPPPVGQLEIRVDLRMRRDVEVGVQSGAKTAAGRGLMTSRCVHDVLLI